MSLILLEHPLSPYAQKNKIALREKGLEFQLRTPGDLGSADSGSEFVEANPRAEVPVLLHDDLAVFDSTIIQDYIEETWPEPGLMPRMPADRARARMIEDVMDTQYEAIVWGFMEMQVFGRAPGELGEQLLARGRQQLSGLHSWLERQLGDREWLNGPQFGWADVAAVPFVMGAMAYRVGPERGRPLSAWLDRTLARPSVAQTAAEGREAGAALRQRRTETTSTAPFRREYRDHRLEWMVRSGGLQVVQDGLAADTIRFSQELS